MENHLRAEPGNILLPSLSQCHRTEATGGGVGSLALQVLQWTGVLWTLCLELG